MDNACQALWSGAALHLCVLGMKLAQGLRKTRLKNELNPFSTFCGKPAPAILPAFKSTEGFSAGPLILNGTTIRPCLSLK